jgi:sulfatase maturation enzyme AslB (radical SAM superfamily)
MDLNKKIGEKQKIIDYLSSQVKDEEISPPILQICLTTACQLNCRYCDMGKVSPPQEMSLAVLKKGIDFLLTSPADTITFQIFGGEPLLRWDLVRNGVEYFQKKTKKLRKTAEVSLTTNAVLLTKEKIDFFKKTGVDFDIVFSFDGQKTTQKFNRPPFKKGAADKYFDLILNNLKMLIFSKTDFFVNMVVGPENLNNLEENVNFLVNQGVKSIRISYAMSIFWEEKAIKNFFAIITKLFNKYKNLLIGIEHCLDEPIITSSALTLMPNEEIVVGPTYPLLEFFPDIKKINSYGRLSDYQSLSQIKRNKREEIKRSLKILSRRNDQEFSLWANNVYMGILYEKLFENLEKN